jgi:hypothetical protein
MKAVLGTVCIALLVFAFAAAPHSCEWGLSAYFWVGVAAACLLALLPVLRMRGRPLPARIGLGLGFAAVVVVVSIVGLFAADVRIMCRLF